MKAAGPGNHNLPDTYDLTIIIVSWNVRDLLARCLRSVEAEIGRMQGPPRVETIVFDNASGDGTAEMVRRRFPWVHLMEHGANIGFARANNLAQQESRSRYYLYLNPDTELSGGSIVGMLRFLEENDTVAAVGPALLNPDGTLQNSSYPAPTLGREFWRLIHLDRIRKLSQYPLEDWRDSGPREVDVIQGACLMVRREAIQQIGSFDESFYIYTEEVDLCQRLRQSGWKVYWLPSLSVIHYGGQSTRQASRQMFLYLYHSKILFFRKHYGRRRVAAYKGILFLASLIRILMFPLLYLGENASRHRRWESASNYARLVLNLPKM